MEAMRILKALNIRPRRTIRAALWAGEEQGLLGSKAYVEQHLAGDKNKAARDKFSVYFNLDNGYPPISGFYMESNDPARAIMAEWLKPMANIGAIMPAPGHIGATDHLSFLDVGVPGFQAVQEYINYDVRTHHTNMDTAERIDPSGAEAGRDGDGGDPVSGVDARRHVPQARAAESQNPLSKNHTKETRQAENATELASALALLGRLASSRACPRVQPLGEGGLAADSRARIATGSTAVPRSSRRFRAPVRRRSGSETSAPDSPVRPWRAIA